MQIFILCLKALLCSAATPSSSSKDPFLISSFVNSLAKLIKIDKERSVDVVITRLRKKIEDSPKNPKYLQTIRGEGYVLWIE